jgi:4-amino-4-deoxy-L-arabinose transferase-like glycosyltransferase
LTLGVGLGRAGCLTYHEAFVAQSTREMVAWGDFLMPRLGGLPWLEKPPLIHWLVALTSWVAGGLSEGVARTPSACAALVLALGVTVLGARHFGPLVGQFAGLIQVTTAWTVMRGRLADADMLLACLVTWAIVAFDRVRAGGAGWMRWRWAFFALLGMTSLVKGIGFGAVLVLVVVAALLAWDRDRMVAGSLWWGRGWALAAALALTWPALVVLRQPGALQLWALHVSDRLAARPEHFASEPWWRYVLGILAATLPWAPLALMGAARAFRRAIHDRGGPDRLYWAWAAAPVAVLSLATVRHAHYLIYALPPWSIWSALSLIRIGDRLRARKWSAARIQRAAIGGFAGLGLMYALGFAVLGPWFDRRGIEWAFYAQVARQVPAREAIAFLYDDWDRNPYATPFGAIPHDLGVRLYYLNRPACWRFGVDGLAERPPAGPGEKFAVVGRERDLPALSRLGRVDTVASGPSVRRDRTYRVFQITPRSLAVKGEITRY